MIDVFRIWFDSHFYVSIDIFTDIFKFLIPSALMTYLMGVKPGFFKKAVSHKNNRENASSAGSKLLNGFIIVLYAVNFCVLVISILRLIVFSLLAVGL